jgi:hypothetical protein
MINRITTDREGNLGYRQTNSAIKCAVTYTQSLFSLSVRIPRSCQDPRKLGEGRGFYPHEKDPDIDFMINDKKRV